MRERLQAAAIQCAIDMTPMIDVVFQLLIFFVMTFRILSPETEFLMKAPLQTVGGPPSSLLIPPLRLEIMADASGQTSAICLNGEPLADFASVTRKLLILRSAYAPGHLEQATELEIAFSPNLKYAQAVQSLEAVTGVRNTDGTTSRLLEKVRFVEGS